MGATPSALSSPVRVVGNGDEDVMVRLREAVEHVAAEDARRLAHVVFVVLDSSGIVANVKAARARFPARSVLVLLPYDDAYLANSAMRAGASYCCVATEPAAHLIDLVARCAARCAAEGAS